MPKRFRDQILKALAKHDGPWPMQGTSLAGKVGVADEQHGIFLAAIEMLQQESLLKVDSDGDVSLPPIDEEVVGVLRKNPKGFGFLIPNTPNAHGDLFVPPGKMADALHGDTVRARTVHGMRRGKKDITGVVLEVLQRAKKRYVGALQKRGKDWLVFTDGHAFDNPVLVRDPGAKNARDGDKVAIELLRYPEGGTLGEGVVTDVLGQAGEPDAETEAIIAGYDLPGPFPQACLEQARKVSAAFDAACAHADAHPDDAFPEREDIRHKLVLTIDPPDARDFDDALSLQRVQHNGETAMELGIHIADVSHFVTPGSPLDKEAVERGNSVYLPRRVIPMLPELLSNGVCSLQEGVPRFAKSIFIRYDKRGKVLARAYASTVIKSAKRLTYLEAQALIDGDEETAKQHTKSDPVYSDEIKQTLKELNALAKRIWERRRSQGMIHLELPDVELIYDDTGRVVDAQPEDDAWTHSLIEMCMVEANEAAAVLFERLGVPVLRRTHPDPDANSFEELRKLLKGAGISVPKDPDRHDLQRLLEGTAGTPKAPAVHFATLRCLTKAEYSPALIGHFALASAAYAHFTSPIRRYPDLTVHRATAAFLKRTKNGAAPPREHKEQRKLGKALLESGDCPEADTLLDVGRACNRTEQSAADAERELRKFLVLQLMQEHVGGVFPGVVTGVTRNGVFIQIQRYLVDGMIKASDLPRHKNRPANWRLDERTGSLVDANSGRSYTLGDRVNVAVANVDIPGRKLELLVPADEAEKRENSGKTLTLGDGIAKGDGAGFNAFKAGAQRRSQRSKARDTRKANHRDPSKGPGGKKRKGGK